MMVRNPTVAGSFYPGSASAIREQVHTWLQDITIPPLGDALGGIVPHAGWIYSGRTALHLFKAMSAGTPTDTVILFGAVHTRGLYGPSLYGRGAWRTPLGDALVDEELALQIVAMDGRYADRPSDHAGEHSIEVLVPFVQCLFPEARILPVAMPPIEEALCLGGVAAEAARRAGKRVAVVGSTDLTHYGPRYGLAPAGIGLQGLAWTHANDRRMLDLVVSMRGEGVLPEALARHNACGPGAVAASMAMASDLGASRGELLHYTTSYEVMPDGRPSDFVGYGAVAFVGDPA